MYLKFRGALEADTDVKVEPFKATVTGRGSGEDNLVRLDKLFLPKKKKTDIKFTNIPLQLEEKACAQFSPF